ncbi:hypothetical protein H0I76_15675 [Limibaculum sp. M0105]|uniref:Uncharacterized protein n=1 Tax=Thermohalobaculum xanthum TaxID=2753746 RepID=A0A8J7MAC5_9RHOB|nr:hypothetical protein [Thermohalobaculum xanthum]MBK0400638.1 hypothetical protein [Thermohalobaculum xanthum]
MSRASDAKRQRWQRARQRAGKSALVVYVSDEFISALIEGGQISKKEAEDKHLLADRLGNIIEAMLI